MPTRRSLLAGTAAALTAGVTSASAAVDYEAVPDDVTLSYDEAWLAEYQPALVMSTEARQSSNGLFAYRASSNEENVEVAVYWHRLTHQEGLPGVSGDGHLYDHEPAYVFVEDGSISEIAFSGYHHFASRIEEDRLHEYLVENETTEATHVVLEVVDPWHHYNAARASDTSESERTFVDLEDWTGVESAWRANNVWESTAEEAVYNPYTMRERDTWWDESTLDYRFAQLWRRLDRRLEWYGSP